MPIQYTKGQGDPKDAIQAWIKENGRTLYHSPIRGGEIPSFYRHGLDPSRTGLNPVVFMSSPEYIFGNMGENAGKQLLTADIMQLDPDKIERMSSGVGVAELSYLGSIPVGINPQLRDDYRLANIFDPIEPELDQSVFKGETPRPMVTKFIKDKFYETFEDLVDDPELYFHLVLTGSLTTYQYSETSDCDITVIPDYDSLSGILHLPPNEVRRQCVRLATRQLDGTYVPGSSHPLQYFVIPDGVDPNEMFKKGIRSGWSFWDESWINPPEKDRAHDIKVELPDLYARAQRVGQKLTTLLDMGDFDGATQMFEMIHAKRNLDEASGLGDFSEGNIVYKYLLHSGVFDRLKDIGIHIAGRHDFGWVSTPENWELTKDPIKGPSGWRPTMPQSVIDAYAQRGECVQCQNNLIHNDDGELYCPYCGWEPYPKKIAASHDHPRRVVYNFNHDKIILADEDFDEHVIDADHVILGSYDGENVNLDAASKQWLNANYFKRLWLTEYPGYTLSNVWINDEHVPTRDKNHMTYTEKNPAVVHNPEIFKHAKDPWRDGKNWKDFIKNKGIKVEFQIGSSKDESFDGKSWM
jgi:hypothetical protein